jgi:hypothetical protein
VVVCRDADHPLAASQARTRRKGSPGTVPGIAHHHAQRIS